MKKRIIETEYYGQILRQRLNCINSFALFRFFIAMERKRKYLIRAKGERQ